MMGYGDTEYEAARDLVRLFVEREKHYQDKHEAESERRGTTPGELLWR